MQIYKQPQIMSEIITSKSLWREAGIAGLVLGGVAVILPLISSVIPSSSNAMLSLLFSIVKFALWLAKFAGCIWLVRYFMLKLVKKYDEVDNTSTFNFGMASSFLSALIVSAVGLLQSVRMDKDIFISELTSSMGKYGAPLDSNTMAMIEKISDNMPTITFFSSLIYCFIFGVIVSYIWSRNIPAKDPFAK